MVPDDCIVGIGFKECLEYSEYFVQLTEFYKVSGLYEQVMGIRHMVSYRERSQ
jgi:hypothetical protein